MFQGQLAASPGACKTLAYATEILGSSSGSLSNAGRLRMSPTIKNAVGLGLASQQEPSQSDCGRGRQPESREGRRVVTHPPRSSPFSPTSPRREECRAAPRPRSSPRLPQAAQQHRYFPRCVCCSSPRRTGKWYPCCGSRGPFPHLGVTEHHFRDLGWTDKELCHGVGPRLVGLRKCCSQSCVSPETPVLNCLRGVLGLNGGPGARK